MIHSNFYSGVENIMTEWKAGFDYSCVEAAFALLDGENRIVFDEYLTLNNRNASELPVWMEKLLAEHGLSFQSVTEWSVGAGPGSFTGLRLASSIVMGFAFRKDIKRRCVSTAAAIAGTAGLTAEKVLTLYDGKKNEILGFGLNRKDDFYEDNGFRNVLSNADDAEKMLNEYPVMAALGKDFEAVQKILGAEFSSKVVHVEHLSAVPLITAAPGDFSGKLTDLTYLRPAVFVEPRPIRTDI